MASPAHDGRSGAKPAFPVNTQGVAIDESLLERARALGPVIRQHAEATERARRLAPPVLHAMREAGLFRMLTPRSLGGLEVDPITVARIAEEIAGFDSAAAWALQAGEWAAAVSLRIVA
jgi:alkylation response protein AidB-like acyl-CoA dehydrogenase